MSVLEDHPEPHDQAHEETWPRAEPLFPARPIPAALPEPATEELAVGDSGALRPSAPEPPPTAVLFVDAEERPAGPHSPPAVAAPRKRSVGRGLLAFVELVVLVVFAAALVATLVAGGLLLLTMALRAAAT